MSQVSDEIKVSVIMAAYSEKEEYVRSSIESILAQSYQNFELVIVLDNPENEGLKQIIREYERQDIRIKFLVNDRNLGAYGSRNRAIRHSQGEYIAIMDADDVSKKERLALQVAVMEEEGADAISGYVRVMDEKGNTIYQMNRLPQDSETIKKKMRINDCMPHPALMIRRKMYEELNGYQCLPYGEDYDFLIRAILKGYTLRNVPETILDYRMTQNSLSRKNIFKQYLMMKYCQKKYFKGVKVGTYKEFIKANYSEGKSKRYAKASSYFTKASQAFTQRKFIQMIILLVKAFCISGAYREKMLRYVLQLDWRGNDKD